MHTVKDLKNGYHLLADPAYTRPTRKEDMMTPFKDNGHLTSAQVNFGEAGYHPLSDTACPTKKVGIDNQNKVPLCMASFSRS